MESGELILAAPWVQGQCWVQGKVQFFPIVFCLNPQLLPESLEYSISIWPHAPNPTSSEARWGTDDKPSADLPKQIQTGAVSSQWVQISTEEGLKALSGPQLGQPQVPFTHRKHQSGAWHIVNAQEMVTGTIIIIINSTGRICSQRAFGKLVQPWAGPWRCLPWSIGMAGESLDKGRNVMRGK